ncbi:MAG: UvrD-helicase domain-containing protein [Dysosmobacter sp.]
MAKLKLTEQQQAAVENRGGSLLVSAAAGSGKTKVLVERLFRYVTEDHCHIDDFLIITYTKAAAAELRSKIAAELSKRMAETPKDRHLRSQLLRVYQADIKTVDAFCTALLRENTHLLAQEGERYALTPDFRVLDENDTKLLRQRVLTRYWSGFTRNWTRAARCWRIRWAPAGMTAPWRIWCWKPTKSCKVTLIPNTGSRKIGRSGKIGAGTSTKRPTPPSCWRSSVERDFTTWRALRRAGQSTVGGDLYKGYGEKFLRASRSFVPLAAAQNWEAARVSLDGLEFPRLTTPKGMTEDPEVVRLKGLWENAKTAAKKLAPMLAVSDTEAMEDLQTMAPAMTALLKLTADFSDAYRTEKLRMNCADFSDQEHLATSPAGGAERRAPRSWGRQVAAPLPGDPGGRVSGHQRGAERHFPGGVP